MISVSNFNSFWELYLTIYAFFIFVDLFPGLEKRLPSIIYSYPLGLDDFLTHSEVADIKRCGWQGIIFRYSDIKSFGLITSILCSLSSFILLLIGCYSPEYKISYITSAGLIIILITPISYIFYSMSLGLRNLKLKYVKNNLKYIREKISDADRIAKMDLFLSKDSFIFIHGYDENSRG